MSQSPNPHRPLPQIGIVFSNRISFRGPAKLALFFRIALQFTPTRDRPARFTANRRQYFVMRLAATFVFALSCAAIYAAGAASDLDPALHAIENRYNHAQSLKLDFSESFLASRRPTQTESGVLYLRKPGRMRWEYTSPAGKIFLADGKDTFLYTPDDHRAEKAPLKLSEDDRAPLAFLLGKLDFHKDFQSFESHSEMSKGAFALPSSNERRQALAASNMSLCGHRSR